MECRKKISLDGIIAATNYNDQLISKSIHHFKYGFIKDLHVPLGKLITKSLEQSEIPIPDFIIPIPLHKRRLRWRGFNQSQLLSQIISTNLLPLTQIPIGENILIRQKYTKPQMTIKQRQDRQQNIANAFAITEKEIIKNKTILLIDDVSTTGFTIFECAKVLKEAGAREVYAAVVAHEKTD